MEYKLSEQELKDLMHRTWLKAKKFYIGKENEYFYEYFEREKKQLPIHDVVSSAEVPAVRVRNYNEETGDTEDGTVIDATLNTYLVIPDYNLSMTVRWDKMNCDVLR